MKETMKVVVTIKAEFDDLNSRKDLLEEVKGAFSGTAVIMGGASFTTKSVAVVKMSKKRIQKCDTY
jgi:3-dehydroquinate dehydratase